MRNYILRRLILMIPTFIGITFVTFFITQIVPGGPIEQMLNRPMSSFGEAGTSATDRNISVNQLTEEDMATLREFYGYDKPIIIRYLKWLNNVAHLNFGDSYRYFTPVMEIIASKLPVSIFYGLISTILVYAVCIPLGLVKAIKHRSMMDNASSIAIFAGYAIPPFALGMFLLTVFATKYSFFPLGGFVSDNFSDLSFLEQLSDLFRHAILPLICYMIGSFAFMTMLMKNSVIENMSSDYVKTALAKGVTYKRAIFSHAFRNSLIPIATSFGNVISLFIAGSFLIEMIFNIDGMGYLGYTSIVERDYPIVLGILVIASMLKLVGNLLSDMCVAFVDPRVRFK
ncbi:MAG: ABC transporter permease subunit [Pseudomonadota bacterium]